VVLALEGRAVVQVAVSCAKARAMAWPEEVDAVARIKASFEEPKRAGTG